MAKENLLGKSLVELTSFFNELGEKPFRAKQVYKWLYQHYASDFEQMSDLSKATRAVLVEKASIEAPAIQTISPSSDGTIKFLLDVGGGVEAVYIPEATRATLCVSSQVGCTLNCSFCFTAKQGFMRNLTPAEIIGQLWQVARYISEQNKAGKNLMPVTNIVFMGMGEPLLNWPAVKNSIEIMRSDLGFGLSRKRVTLSTSGVVPKMYEFNQETDVALAVSLHAPNDELRDELVPINRKYPLAKLFDAMHDYIKQDPKGHVTIEYVMLKDVNDTLEHARQLKNLLNRQGVPVKVNLIPFNPFGGTEYRTSTDNQIELFQKVLTDSGIFCFVRKTRGRDIMGACGQLAGEVKDRTRRAAKFKQIMLKEESCDSVSVA